MFLQSFIDFLGVNISDGRYTLQPHIASALAEFPDKLTNAKQMQQFLGIVNYMLDFIPRISRYRNCLAQLLKKSPPDWNSTHTEAVQQLDFEHNGYSSYFRTKKDSGGLGSPCMSDFQNFRAFMTFLRLCMLLQMPSLMRSLLFRRAFLI